MMLLIPIPKEICREIIRLAKVWGLKKKRGLKDPADYWPASNSYPSQIIRTDYG